VENAKKVSEEYQLAGQLTQHLPEANGFQEVWLLVERPIFQSANCLWLWVYL
jgi:hypothetical protein